MNNIKSQLENAKKYYITTDCCEEPLLIKVMMIHENCVAVDVFYESNVFRMTLAFDEIISCTPSE